MGSAEFREMAERYRRQAATCGTTELARLLLVYADAYEAEARISEPERTPSPRDLVARTA
jgi:hypothetical protein